MHHEAQGSTARLSCGDYAISLTTTGTYANWTDGKYPLYIFSSNAGGTVYADATIMRLYSFKIYRDIDHEMVLVHDFIPCVAGNGKAGLYDLVGDHFHGNVRANVEDFEYEVEEPVLPEGYTAAKYIQSTSALQYINTLYWHGTNDLVVMDYYAPRNWQVSSYCYPWGSKASGNDNVENWYFYIPALDWQYFAYSHKTASYSTSVENYDYLADPVHLECQASTATWTCGDATGSLSTTTTFSNWAEGRWPMFIFGCDVAGSVKNDFSTIM